MLTLRIALTTGLATSFLTPDALQVGSRSLALCGVIVVIGLAYNCVRPRMAWLSRLFSGVTVSVQRGGFSLSVL